jgi:hypothetical protein
MMPERTAARRGIAVRRLRLHETSPSLSKVSFVDLFSGRFHSATCDLEVAAQNDRSISEGRPQPASTDRCRLRRRTPNLYRADVSRSRDEVSGFVHGWTNRFSPNSTITRFNSRYSTGNTSIIISMKIVLRI